MKSVYGIIFLMYSAMGFAELQQIDVIGLKPGISTAQEVANTIAGSILTIDRYKIVCTEDTTLFIDNTLSQMVCSFGPGGGAVSPERGLYDRVTTYRGLREGYTNKFGAPTNQTVSALGGVTTIWEDAQGNRLTLISSALTPRHLNPGPRGNAYFKEYILNSSGRQEHVLESSGRRFETYGWLFIESRAQIEKDTRYTEPESPGF